jgi:NAD-dependent dihydropyrimidine dehydrogenase PreA subunit
MSASTEEKKIYFPSSRVCKICYEVKQLTLFQETGNYNQSKQRITYRHTCKKCYLESIRENNAINYQKRKIKKQLLSGATVETAVALMM